MDLKMIRNLLLSSCFIFLSACSDKPDYEKTMTQLKTEGKSEILIDLFKKEKFVPPYQDYSSLVRVAKICKEDFFDNEPIQVDYLRLMIKEDALGLAAGINGLLSSVIKNSGGSISLSEEVIPEIIDLYNIGASKSKSANKVYNAFIKSPQIKKLQDYIKQASLKEVSDKKITKLTNEQNKAGLLFICSRIDIYYTMLGGTEYSNTADIYPNVKKLIRSQSNIGKSTLLNKMHNK